VRERERWRGVHPGCALNHPNFERAKREPCGELIKRPGGPGEVVEKKWVKKRKIR